MEYWKDLSAIVQSSMTSIAIVIGGIWTYLLFVRQRLNYPKLIIELEVVDHLLTDNQRLVHAEVKISNVGSVILDSDYAELRIRQVSPVPEEHKKAIEAGNDPVEEGEAEVLWPLINEREWKWEKGHFEIEPGEADSLHADFIIENDINLVEFYFYIKNGTKVKSKLGWPLTKIHNTGE